VARNQQLASCLDRELEIAFCAGDTLANSISSLSWFDLKLNRAVSNYNIPRVFVINGTWNFPSTKSATEALAWVANACKLGSILRVQDGIPITPLFGNDRDPFGLNSSDPYVYPNRLFGPGCSTLTNPGNVANHIKTQCFASPAALNMTFWGCDLRPECAWNFWRVVSAVFQSPGQLRP
jgi:hypothetical protein